MNSLAAIVRSLFGTQALVIVLAIGTDLFYLIQHFLQGEGSRSPESRISSAVFMVLLALIGLGATGLNALVWWMLRNGHPGTRIAMFWVALVNLALPPMGTITGILALVLCAKNRSLETAQMSATARERIAGDGTHPWMDRLSVLAQVVFLGVSAHLWNTWRIRQHLPIGDLIPDLLLAEAALITNTFLHEAGHVLAGWSNGMFLANLAIGPFAWRMEEGTRRFRFHAPGLFGGGHAGLVPFQLDNLRRRFLWITLGGPAASLVTAIVATALALTAPGRPWESWWNFLSMLSTFAILGSVFNLIPVRPQDQYSDGAQIVQLLRGGPWADVHLARAMVSSSLVTPLRPAEWDETLLKRSADFLQSGFQGMLMRLYLMIQAVDRSLWNDAARYLREAEALYPQAAATLPAELYSEFIVMCAVLRHDPVSTRWWWEQMEGKKSKRKESDYWLSRTAWCYAEGQYADAWESYAQAFHFVHKLPHAGAYEVDRLRLALVRNALEAVSATHIVERAGLESISGEYAEYPA